MGKGIGKVKGTLYKVNPSFILYYIKRLKKKHRLPGFRLKRFIKVQKYLSFKSKIISVRYKDTLYSDHINPQKLKSQFY